MESLTRLNGREAVGMPEVRAFAGAGGLRLERMIVPLTNNRSYIGSLILTAAHRHARIRPESGCAERHVIKFMQ